MASQKICGAGERGPHILSFNPYNKVKPSILLPWETNSSLLINKLSEFQGYLVPTNAKPLPQQTVGESSSSVPNTLHKVTLALYPEGMPTHQGGHLSGSGNNGKGERGDDNKK